MTDPAALLAEQPLSTQQVPATERPNMLVTVPMKSGTPSGSERDEAHAPSGAGSCWLTGSENLGHKDVNVGELHLNRDWGGLFSYSTTKSSSFEIGVSHQGSGWGAGGSVSMAKNTEFGQPVRLATAETDRYWNWKAKMVYKRFEWGCNKGYPDVHRADTLEPTLWTGDLRRSTEGNPATCNEQFAINVEPTSEPYRKGGSSQTLRGAINVLGFSGSVTSGFSKEVRNEWHNPLDRNRTLCGETGYITERTRVTSLA